MQAAQHYAQVEAKGATAKVERELKLEALARALRGELSVLFMANSARDIRNAVEFAEKWKLKMILCGGGEAWEEKNLLAEKKIPVILRPTQSPTGEEDQAHDKPVTN